jgi:hypothetical protein
MRHKGIEAATIEPAEPMTAAQMVESMVLEVGPYC